MKVDISVVKDLREKTGLSVIECKNALEETAGDIEQALEVLKKKGLKPDEKKLKRDTNEGAIGSYVHLNGKVGTLIEVNCETDFVARNDDFKELVKDITLQITATNPQWIDTESVPEEIKNKQIEIIKEQFKDKPEKIIEKIAEGKLQEFYKEKVLLEQPFVKDDAISIKEYINSKIAKLGENIKIKRFVRFEIGE
jgi:elongation factor Ts